jgi:hypothetical protein
MKIILASIILVTFAKCGSKPDISCKKQFYQCAEACSNICSKTIKRKHEFGKCFSICNRPCREEYCEEIVKL